MQRCRDQGHTVIRHGRPRDRRCRIATARNDHGPRACARRPRQHGRLRPAKAALRHGREQVPEIEEAREGRIHAGPQAQVQSIQRRRNANRRRIAHDHRRRAAGNQALTQQARRHVGVQRQQARIDLRARERNHRPFDAVAAPHGDNIVDANAPRHERIRQHVGILVPVAIAQRRRSFEQRGFIAAHRRPVLKAASRRLAQALSVVRTFVTRQSRMCDRET